MGRNKARLAGGIGLLVVWQLCEALVPVLIGVIIDRAVATSDGPALALWGATFVLLFGCLSMAFRFGSRLGFTVVQLEMHRLRREIAGHALHPRGVRTPLLPGETLSLATSDTEVVGLVIRSLGYTVAGLGSLALSAWVLLRIDLTLGVVVLVGVPLVLLLIQVVTPVIARRTTTQQASVAAASGTAADLVAGLRVLKGLGAEDVAAERYRIRSQDAARAGIRAADAHGTLLGLTQGLSGLFLALVALLAGRLALDGTITVGELVAVVGLTQFLAEPIGMLGQISAHTAAAHASARRIVDFLHTPHLVDSGPRTPHDDPITLTLHAAQAPGLAGLTLATRPDELLGVVSTDPAGAAGLVRLLAGEVAADERAGVVELAGIELHELDITARHERLVVAPHHVDLFEGTLRSNVDPTGACDEPQLDRLLSAAAADDVVALHEDGADQSVSPDGATFSGGQRQRIALARALAADPTILVLHDPTTAVDAVTELRIADGIRDLRHGPDSTRSTVLITTSPALLSRADRVVLLVDGRVAAEGTHHDLAAHPAYRDLVLR